MSEIIKAAQALSDEDLGAVAGGVTKNYLAALDVMAGKYGNGEERKARLAAAGYDFWPQHMFPVRIEVEGALRGNNERASRYAGIEARRIKWLTYVICGFCAGMAGLLAASNIKCADSNNAGLNLELDAILATVIGGTSMAGGRFFLSGSLVGAILIQTLTTTMYMKNVSPAIVAVPKAMVVIIVCLLQSPVFRAKVLSIFASKAAKGGVQ